MQYLDDGDYIVEWCRDEDAVTNEPFTTIRNSEGDEIARFPGVLSEAQAQAVVRMANRAFRQGWEGGRQEMAQDIWRPLATALGHPVYGTEGK